MTKIIFLDIDGPLATMSNVKKLYDSGITDEFVLSKSLDPDCVERFNRICSETDAKIVVISDWRKNPDILNMLQERGITGNFHAAYKTDKILELGEFKEIPRGEEINLWLLEYVDAVESYTIVEDEKNYLLPGQLQRVVLTDGPDGPGLQDEHIEQIREILNTPLQENAMPKGIDKLEEGQVISFRKAVKTGLEAVKEKIINGDNSFETKRVFLELFIQSSNLHYDDKLSVVNFIGALEDAAKHMPTDIPGHGLPFRDVESTRNSLVAAFRKAAQIEAPDPPKKDWATPKNSDDRPKWTR